MQNPFNHENYPSNELKRNTFPCSFQNNLTMKYGYIYPAGIWRTVPGATYKIKPTLGLNFMPTTFPVQTRQKVYVHYFYGRDRNFWKDYKDFVNGQRPDLVKPYIDESVTQARTGKLLDYLGVPTTLVGRYGTGELADTLTPVEVNSSKYFMAASDSYYGSVENVLNHYNNRTVAYGSDTAFGHTYLRIYFLSRFDMSNVDLSSISFIRTRVGSYAGDLGDGITYINDWLNKTFTSTLNDADDPDAPYVSPTPREENVPWRYFSLVFSNDSELSTSSSATCVPCSALGDNGLLTFDLSNISLSSYRYCYLTFNSPLAYYNKSDNDTRTWKQLPLFEEPIYGSLNLYGSLSSVQDINETNSPYWRSGAPNDLREKIKLNAYLPRFYETVYNLYYRNPQNNPYILDGRPEYNKFIPTKDGGVDTNKYELRRRNWEDDFLTTAVQSPQQGIAPLVGLTDRGATLTLTNEDGSVTRYNVTTTENGSITGIEANDTTAEPVLTKALIDAVSYGISIEDIRNVNAMQKWLELNLRKGYQYKDIIQARWGISISYNELDLPEFIGGFTKDVQLQAVTQTANVNDDVTGQLGWQAGRLFASGEGREITHYCDEEGYIMCLITVVPVPNYSQLLPKHWFERDLLDSYQPEFNHIGFQPITYKEVCPVQAYQESTENVNVLEQTFGYQRPWYQYFNYTDEVHGQFRTSFKDFLINRVFDVKPELSESFLLVDPEQINDVFNVTDADDDKILGAIYHNCVAKLPISLYAQARLE